MTNMTRSGRHRLLLLLLAKTRSRVSVTHWLQQLLRQNASDAFTHSFASSRRQWTRITGREPELSGPSELPCTSREFQEYTFRCTHSAIRETPEWEETRQTTESSCWLVYCMCKREMTWGPVWQWYEQHWRQEVGKDLYPVLRLLLPQVCVMQVS